MMKQNIYDDPVFFAQYRTLRLQDQGLNGHLEEPALFSLLPSLQGQDVLDLGCGFGLFAQKAVELGARSVVGVDISHRMVEQARQNASPGVRFEQSAVEDYNYPTATYDVVVSSLCLHYVKNVEPVWAKIWQSLRPDGVVVFSVEHPVCTALAQGWMPSGDQKQFWPVDHYFAQGERHQSWLVDDVIKYHRTLESYLNGLLAAGLQIDRILEPTPTADALELHPHLQDHARRPALLVVRVHKKA